LQSVTISLRRVSNHLQTNYVDAVYFTFFTLTLLRGFSVTMKNTKIFLLRFHSTCQACMSVRDQDGKSVFDRLIAKMPDAVLVRKSNALSVNVRAPRLNHVD
jgi:hypothetical protein